MIKNKILPLLVVLLLLSDSAYAVGEEDVKDRILGFVGSRDAVVVIGEYSSSAERLIVMLTKSTYPEIKEIPVFEEEEFDKTLYNNQAIILIGGPSQNKISKQVLDSSPGYSIEKFSGGKIVFLDNYMIYSDFSGFGNNPRTSQYNSPLSSVMPLAFVPVAATLISLSMLWLWNLLKNIFESFYNGLIVDKLMNKVKKKEVRKEYKGFDYKGLRIKYREWAYIVLSAAVFAVAISYTYITGNGAFSLILTGLFVNITLSFFQNLFRLLMDKSHNIHTEYHLWNFGVFLTLFSGWLGNTFGLAGYVSSEKGHEPVKAKILYNSVCFTFILGILFLIINMVAPFQLAQVIMVSALTSCFMDMLPITPFSGKEIIKWNRKLWKLAFIPILCSYLFLSLFY